MDGHRNLPQEIFLTQLCCYSGMKKWVRTCPYLFRFHQKRVGTCPFVPPSFDGPESIKFCMTDILESSVQYNWLELFVFDEFKPNSTDKELKGKLTTVNTKEKILNDRR